HALACRTCNSGSVDGELVAVQIGHAGGAELLIKYVSETLCRRQLELRKVCGLDLEVDDIHRAGDTAVQEQVGVAYRRQSGSRCSRPRRDLRKADLRGNNRDDLLALR